MSAKRFGVWLAVAVAFGLALRLAYAYALVKSRPLLGDALEFQNIANLLADGHGFIQPGPWLSQHITAPTADKPPLFPLLEAGVSLLGGRSWQAHQLVGCLTGGAVVGLVGVIGRTLRDARVGLLA